MIKLLHIENIAVIERADIEFAPGLNVLTGETGAGKSIVIDSLSAVTGGRTSREIIRTGAEYASVAAVFAIDYDESADNADNADNSDSMGISNNGSDSPTIYHNELDWLRENGIEPDESGEIHVTRRITSDGKSVCRINGVPVPVAQLRDLGSHLLDIHGQNDGRKLLDESAHRSYLDQFGRLGNKVEEYRVIYNRLADKRSEIESLTLDESEKERRLDTLRYQVNEIETAKLRIGEHDELISRREMLLNASRLTDALDAAFEAMYGGEYSDGAVALISEAQSELERAAGYADGLCTIGERLTDLRYTAQDITDELRIFRAQLEFTPGELEELEARLDTINRIIRKYGHEEDALAFLEASVAEISDIEDSSNILNKLNLEFNDLLTEARAKSDELSEMRKEAAKSLETMVSSELSQLNMPNVMFLVEFTDAKGENNLTSSGSDEVSFLMSANAGEKPGKINRIASGGELARIMLALKNVLSSGQDTGAVVFDEIDSGVSGIAAQRVGEKLVKLAALRQVLCVTHLPQIAVMADAHFEILKNTSGGRTYTQVNELDLEGRKSEIARLSGGENITTTTLESAAEQLASAASFKADLANAI